MATVVQAACPGCKKLLRIPGEWLHQTIRCKHCGLVVLARPAAVVAQPIPPPPTVAFAPVPAATSRLPVAAPAASNAFTNLDDDADGGALVQRRRRSRGRWKGAIVSALMLAAIGGLAVAFWPQLKQMAGQAATELAAHDAPEKAAKEPAPVEKKAPKADDSTPHDPPKPSSPKKEPAKKDGDKEEPAKKTNKGKDAPRKDAPKKDAPKPNPPVRSTKEFPRRALTISVNNYLFLNPINYGAPDRKANSVRTLRERFTTGLRVPMEQSFELSDAAAMGRARPPVKAAIEKAVTDFVATSRPQDRIILLLIAHTVEIDDETYVIPLEGDQETKDGLIPLSWIMGKLAGATARQKILILDTCRFDPTRGQERPGGGPMGEKTDAKLKEPPPGVQVWTACVGGQQSYEFDSSANGNVNNGLFLDCLQRALVHGIEGTIQRPDEPMLLQPLVAKVNALMKTELDPLKLMQTSRLTGTESDGGAPYDPSQPPAAKIVVDVPRPAGEDTAPLAEVRVILKDIDVPPLKLTRDDMLMRAESMPPFSAKVLAEYKSDGQLTPFREAVEIARKALNDQVKGKRLREEWQLMGGNENAHKKIVEDYQKMELARTLRQLEEALDDLRQAGKEGRKAEKSKRWQANYDYILARLEAQIAYLYEYDSALGEMRKELPEKGPNGWRLASQKKLSGDSAGRKLANESGKLLDKLTKDHAGTPWAVLAKRVRLSNLGLKWQPNK